MHIHFYITPKDLARYKEEGSCYVTKERSSELFHISFSLSDHTIEKTFGDIDEYILRKIL